jgi:hypothetical protein
MTSKATLGPADLDAFTAALNDVVARAKSIAEIAQWLEEQPFVASVQTMDYLRKTAPPQREILVELRTGDASIESRRVTIYELGPDQFQLHRLRPV